MLLKVITQRNALPNGGISRHVPKHGFSQVGQRGVFGRAADRAGEIRGAKIGPVFQFVRQGFFCVDAKDSTPEHLVFNRIVSLKSSFKLPSNN